MKRIVAALACAFAVAAQAQQNCSPAEEMAEAQLVGTWVAQVEGSAPLTLELHPDPDFAETVRGSLQRDGQRFELAGDVGDGELTLEESVNGRNISAHWLGDVVDGSCGREIRGTWQAEGTSTESAFVMRKQ